ncbi:phage major capsid protein [Enterococcus casseliflavus]|uniref:phage major capsid protein n=1 Tax=Enterococcus casseliflavus TaxID=37734 RepID=UPI002FDC5CB1
MNFEEIQKLLEEGKTAEANAALDQLMKDNPEAKAIFEEPKQEPVENKALENKKPEEVANLKKVGEVKDVATPNYEEVFAKILMGRELDPQDKVAYEKVNNVAYTHQVANQPILIPETTMAGILGMIEEQHPFYGSIRKLNVRGNLTIKQHISVDAGDASFVDEGTPAEDEKNTFAEITLTGFEVAKLVRVSFMLDAMSIEDFILYIQQEIADRVGRTLGKAIFTGTGVKQPKGVLTVLAEQSGTPQVVSTTAIKYSDLTALRSKIASQFAPGAKFYASSTTIWSHLANVMDGADGTGSPIFIRELVDGGVGTIFGIPVVEDDGVPEGEILLGNPAAGVIQNTNRPFTIQSETSVADREIRYQGYAILDWAVTYTQAFAHLKVAAGGAGE